jgi:hypothetical protein
VLMRASFNNATTPKEVLEREGGRGRERKELRNPRGVFPALMHVPLSSTTTPNRDIRVTQKEW